MSEFAGITIMAPALRPPNIVTANAAPLKRLAKLLRQELKK
jgi:hypothetical protein